MALILQIDTAGPTASVAIARDGIVSSFLANENMNDHAAFLQPAIQAVLQEQGLSLKNMDAIAVNIGPGSYTGLRVGLSSAKGLCYALQKPLITVGSLQVIALDSSKQLPDPAALYIPMIDARRMEVFTAAFNYEAVEIRAAHALLLTEQSFAGEPADKKLVFSGNGADKFSRICLHKNAVFLKSGDTVQSFAKLSLENFNRKAFADLAYAEPLYVKEFYDSRK